LSELLVHPECPGALADPVQHDHQPAHAGLVVRRKRDRPPRPVHALARPAIRQRMVAHRPGCPGRPAPQTRTLAVEPLPELGGHAGDEEARQEVAGVEVERRLRPAGDEGLLEYPGVAPERGGIEPDVFVTPANHDRAEAAPEKVQALAERVAALLQIELGPEQAQQRVASMEAVRRGGGEVGEEGETLGLGHHRPGPVIGAVRAANINGAKGPDPHESGHCGFNAQSVTCRVTDRGRSGDGWRAISPIEYGRRPPRSAQSIRISDSRIAMTNIALRQVQPLDSELKAIATDVLQGLQYSFVAAAAHPAIRLPFGSLEEAFQDSIALRPAEQRWIYHSRARRFAMLPGPALEAAFGRFGRLPAEEFAHVGLADAFRHLPSRGRSSRPRLALVPAARPSSLEPEVAPASGKTLALYITDVSCLDRTGEEPLGKEIAVAGLAIEPSGRLAKVGRFLVPEDVEHGVGKVYGRPGRKFCEFALPERLGREPMVYGAAAFLEVADRAGFSEALAGAWAKASPILKEAVEVGMAGAKATTVSRAAGYVVERFVQWLGEEFHEDLFPPGLAFAAAAEGRGETGRTAAELTFAGRGGRYRVEGQWRVSWT
jgi:hypothetical protein